MIAKRHVRRRLGQYGALRLGSFVLTLIVTTIMVFAVGAPTPRTWPCLYDDGEAEDAS